MLYVADWVLRAIDAEIGSHPPERGGALLGPRDRPVLTHLVPPPRNSILRRSFERGVAESYTGEITVGEDGMRFALAPAAGATP